VSGKRYCAVALGVAAVVLALPLASCGSDDDAAADEQSVLGVIISVDAPSLTELRAFTLRANDGRELTFSVAPDAHTELSEGFVPGHLRTHAVEVAQVRVFYREEHGELLALRLVHATATPVS
jgi:hypothetical protein